MNTYASWRAEPQSPADETWFRAAWATLNAKPCRTNDDFEREAALMEEAIIEAFVKRMARRAEKDYAFVARVHARARQNRQLRHWATRLIRRPKRETNQ